MIPSDSRGVLKDCAVAVVYWTPIAGFVVAAFFFWRWNIWRAYS